LLYVTQVSHRSIISSPSYPEPAYILCVNFFAAAVIDIVVYKSYLCVRTGAYWRSSFLLHLRITWNSVFM